MYDTRLVMAAQHGDEAAFAALYDRNADAVYDLCLALVGDQEEASRLTTLVFTLAARHLIDISDASQVRPWLLAITRDRVLAEDEAGTLRSAWGSAGASSIDAEGGAGEPDAEASIEPLGTADLRRWTREAAATLALADQVVVELCTRYDLDPDQLTAAIGCAPNRLEPIISQVEQEAEQVLGSLVLARQGRKDCKRLAGLLAAWDGRPSVEVAEVADRHAATCERCRRRRALVSPLELLAACPSTLPPPGLRAQVLDHALPELPGPSPAPREGGAAVTAAAVAAAAAAGVVGTTTPVAAWPADTAAVAAGAGAAGAAGGVVAAGAAGGVGGAGARPGGTAGPGAPGPATVVLPAALLPAAGGAVIERTVAAPPRTARSWGLVAAIVGAVVVLILAIVLLLHSSGNSTKLALAPTPTTAAVAPGTTTATTAAPAPASIAPIDATTIASTLAAAAGSQLTLNTSGVDFGADATSAQIVLSDTGAGPAGWHATVPVTWLTITPPSGYLQPSGQVEVTFTINRGKAPNGPFDIKVSFVPSDATGTPASLTVAGTNTEPPPTTTTAPTTTTPAGTASPQITGVGASPSTIEAAPCSADQSVVSATVRDPSGVSSVIVDYTLPGGAAGTATMTQSGAGASSWSASIGGSAITGKITYDVHATDANGQSTTSPSSTITVRACPL